jgi:hypothetical protein
MLYFFVVIGLTLLPVGTHKPHHSSRLNYALLGLKAAQNEDKFENEQSVSKITGTFFYRESKNPQPYHKNRARFVFH